MLGKFPVRFQRQDRWRFDKLLLKQFLIQIEKWCAVEYCWQFTIMFYSLLSGGKNAHELKIINNATIFRPFLI